MLKIKHFCFSAFCNFLLLSEQKAYFVNIYRKVNKKLQKVTASERRKYLIIFRLQRLQKLQGFCAQFRQKKFFWGRYASDGREKSRGTSRQPCFPYNL